MNNKTRTNPWPGLSSYQDPETVDVRLKFCGRDNESYDVAQLIDDNIFVTLYSKSGIGKTSLLNAGVFPRLRLEQYLPVSIRLSMDARDISFQQCILAKLSQALQGRGTQTTFEVVPMPDDEHATEYLWSYFARTKFTATDGSPLFPVLVFDQFEEVFRNRCDDAKTLLRQIYFMMDESHALSPRMVDDGQPYQYDFNFRFVVSIREDDLYRIEDAIDNCYLPDMKRCRYRLRSLTDQGASDAILKPGDGLFLSEEEKYVVSEIIEKSRNEDGSISTNIISLLCSRIFVEFQRSDARHITLQLVKSFMEGNPFEKFYNEATRDFSEDEKSYLEDHLVDSTGRRDSISESEFLKHVKNGADLLKGERKILQRTNTSSDSGNRRVELIHDSFCEPLSKMREQRKQLKEKEEQFREQRKQLKEKEEQFRKERKENEKFENNMIKVYLSALACVFAFFIYYPVAKIVKVQSTPSLSRVLRAVAEEAFALVDEGDSYLARLLALQALPPNTPDTLVEAESALRYAVQYDNAILRGHTDYVSSASFSPDGKRIVSASRDNTIRIWDAQTGELINTLEGHKGVVSSASFSPDGKRIVSASADKTIRIWDAQTGELINTLEGHKGVVSSASFSPDGKRIVSASADKTIRIWDAQKGKLIYILKGHEEYVYSSAFSPDGKRIVSASADKTIRIWDAQKGKLIYILEGHKNYVYSAAFSPDGKSIVSASWDKTVRIWDAQTGKPIYILEGHKNYVYSAAFSPDGKRIVSASRDMTVRIWDAQTGKQIGTLERNIGYVYSAAFSPDGKRIVSASWKSGNTNSFIPSNEDCIGDPIIRIWDTQTEKQINIPLKGHTEQILSAAFNFDGKRIVSASMDSTIRIWDVHTGKQIGNPLVGHTGWVRSAFFSHNGNRIVSASMDSTIRIWDAQTGEQIGKPLKGHKDLVYSASFSSDGNCIVSASADKTIRIWNAQTGKQIGKPLEGHNDKVRSASFSFDGNRIVSASWDNTIRIWDAHTGKQIGKSLIGHTKKVNSAVFSPDSKLIVSASDDNTIRIWDAQTGKQIGNPLEGHTGYVYSVAFGSDGKYIISASDDKTIRIWDKTGKQIGKLKGHTGWVYSAAFSPDGQRIVSASADKTIRIWDFPPLQHLQQLIDETRERFKNRPLTPEERRKYHLE